MTKVLPELETQARRRHRDDEAPAHGRRRAPAHRRWTSRTRATRSRSCRRSSTANPPVARVDGDAIVALGDTVPARRREEERELLRRLRDELNLVPGRRVDLDGSEAIRFAAKLREWQKRTGDEAHATAFSRPPPAPAARSSNGDAFDVVFECDSRRRRGERVDPEARRGRGRPPRLARRARPRAARRRRLGAAARRLARASTATASPTCSRRATRTRSSAPPRCRRLGAALRRARRAAAARARAARAALRGVRGHPARAAARGAHTRRCAPTSRQGVDWLSFLRDAGLGARARRRHGPRQDAADALRPSRAGARRLPEERRLQLGRRDRALPPGPSHRDLPRAEARARPRAPTSR